MRLIDADALKQTINEHDYVLRDMFNSTDKGMFTIGIDFAINEQPTIDAVPVVHGEWGFEEYPDGYYHTYCSVCNAEFHEDVFLKEHWNYCPNCGAKMDGKEKNDEH